MTRKELELIADTISVDWIEDNAISVYEIMSTMVDEMMHMYDRIQMQNELMKGFDEITKKLNTENKKLNKLLRLKQ